MLTIHGNARGRQVSVITPVFNGVRTIATAIASVQAQTFVDWELLVIDDGSSDGSADVVSRVAAESRLRLIRQERGGPGAARNRGISAAVGELVAFLDADDLWPPGYLAAMTAALSRRPGASLAFGSWQYIDENGALLSQRVIPFDGDGERAAAELPWRNAIVPSAVVVRSSALCRVGGFDTSFGACEDWDLWLRLIAEGGLVGVPKAWALYRARAGSLTEDLEVMERERLRLNEKYHGPMGGDLALWPYDRRRAVGHTFFVSGLAYLRRRDDELGRQNIRRALEVWPGLAEEDELYYELACARQPRGRRGPSRELDLDESERLIEWVLPDTGGRPLPARACLALGRLALHSGNRRAARHHAWTALQGSDWGTGRAAIGLLGAAVLPTLRSSRARA